MCRLKIFVIKNYISNIIVKYHVIWALNITFWEGNFFNILLGQNDKKSSMIMKLLKVRKNVYFRIKLVW